MRAGWIVILMAVILAVGSALLLIWSGLAVPLSLIVAVNCATIMAYGCDKQLARAGWHRVPELVLHLLAAAGGTPGALFAQVAFRHKTRDGRFQVVFFCILALQVAVVLAIAYWFRR